MNTGSDGGRYFGAQDVFQKVTFGIEHGDRIGLVGNNGEGKTTLLNLLAGLDHPTNGSIHRKGELRIGYLPQHPGTDSGSDSTPRPQVRSRCRCAILAAASERGHCWRGCCCRSRNSCSWMNRPTLDLEATEWLEG